MNEDLQAIAKSMRESKHSFIKEELTEDDVMKILREVGNFIRDHQLRGNAVYVKDIGLFTLFQQKLIVSNLPVKYVFSQKPVFQLSHRLASKFRIKWARQIAETKLPQKCLNSTTIALKCGIDRSKVVLCLYELLAFMEKSLNENNGLWLPIYGVGTIKIDEDEWRMDFDKGYLEDISIDNVLYVVEDM